MHFFSLRFLSVDNISTVHPALIFKRSAFSESISALVCALRRSFFVYRQAVSLIIENEIGKMYDDPTRLITAETDRFIRVFEYAEN